METSRTPAGVKRRGGVSKWSKIESDGRRLLGDSSITVLTTMLDFYRLPRDVPGVSSLPASPSPHDRVAHIERAMAAAIGSPRFKPNIMLHETEAMVFAAPDAAAARFSEPSLGVELRRIAAQCGGPELVDDGPSRRLQQLCPRYDKVIDGPDIIADAGVDAVLARCPHAGAWIRSLLG